MELIANAPQVCVRHGRQFHGSDSSYALPNDEREFNRLNNQFQALKLITGSNYTAPLPQLNSGEGPKDILDIAAGSGIWVIELALEFPQARVVGIDLSKPGLFGRAVPQNASFNVADIRGIVQLVELSPPVSRKGYRPPALNEAEQAVARGGYMHKNKENPSLDGDGNPASWSIADRIAPALRAAPSMWTNVQEKRIGVPIGTWASDEVGQEAGRIMQRQTVELFNGFRPNLIDVGGMSADEVDGIIARLADELEDGPKWELEIPYEFIWAVKR
ncbi:unnamed protein product [Rhizoctonia solani]|uniref:Methyltransferase domain-containing protein n=1 Tax=Rhizoctonia solani TaxID=456999 RepID=A0A8H3AQQ0_9AGAM|nr:unnamed protein product [Rhizoctonia solani]